MKKRVLEFRKKGLNGLVALETIGSRLSDACIDRLDDDLYSELTADKEWVTDSVWRDTKDYGSIRRYGMTFVMKDKWPKFVLLAFLQTLYAIERINMALWQ